MVLRTNRNASCMALPRPSSTCRACPKGPCEYRQQAVPRQEGASSTAFSPQACGYGAAWHMCQPCPGSRERMP